MISRAVDTHHNVIGRWWMLQKGVATQKHGMKGKNDGRRRQQRISSSSSSSAGGIVKKKMGRSVDNVPQLAPISEEDRVVLSLSSRSHDGGADGNGKKFLVIEE